MGDRISISFVKKNNDRILFSGIFGIGKTYFLDKFFKENKGKYEYFHLYPVNYQILQNNDVVELLKYDILISLLNKNKNRKEDLFENKDISLFSYIKQNFSMNTFLKKGVSYLEFGELGKMLGRPLKDLLELDKKYQEYKKGENGFVKNFITEVEEKDITEVDYLSYVLSNKITKLSFICNHFAARNQSIP